MEKIVPLMPVKLVQGAGLLESGDRRPGL